MDWNAPEWTGTHRNGYKNLFVLCNLIYHFTIIYVEISVSVDIVPFEVHMSTVSGLLHS